jgi:hypothetical protein
VTVASYGAGLFPRHLSEQGRSTPSPALSGHMWHHPAPALSVHMLVPLAFQCVVNITAAVDA